MVVKLKDGEFNRIVKSPRKSFLMRKSHLSTRKTIWQSIVERLNFY